MVGTLVCVYVVDTCVQCMHFGHIFLWNYELYHIIRKKYNHYKHYTTFRHVCTYEFFGVIYNIILSHKVTRPSKLVTEQNGIIELKCIVNTCYYY